jgi:hypothetical protein
MRMTLTFLSWSVQIGAAAVSIKDESSVVA